MKKCLDQVSQTGHNKCSTIPSILLPYVLESCWTLRSFPGCYYHILSYYLADKPCKTSQGVWSPKIISCNTDRLLPPSTKYLSSATAALLLQALHSLCLFLVRCWTCGLRWMVWCSCRMERSSACFIKFVSTGMGRSYLPQVFAGNSFEVLFSFSL